MFRFGDVGVRVAPSRFVCDSDDLGRAWRVAPANSSVQNRQIYLPLSAQGRIRPSTMNPLNVSAGVPTSAFGQIDSSSANMHHGP